MSIDWEVFVHSIKTSLISLNPQALPPIYLHNIQSDHLVNCSAFHVHAEIFLEPRYTELTIVQALLSHPLGHLGFPRVINMNESELSSLKLRGVATNARSCR